ncbi:MULTISPECIES: hypothetical protein [unclassified Aureimonas]|uniref:hypothetical protein n=1 Tax=unclassified Aureimonas TaxID=2615206 RepID=UPI0012E3DBCC|nr:MULTISPECIES: hypothetical protein [unclassified Aureimonas]
MSSLSEASRRPALSGLARLAAPTTFALALPVLAALLLCLKLTLPLGPMYWDLVVFFDGAQRVLSGQIPSVDFFAPVGALGYWLFAAGLKLFPEAQPLLLAQWMLLVVTLPPLLPVLRSVETRSRCLAFALLVPFAVFQMLPMNVEQYSTYPSVDGYGIYNRQVAEVLYVLTTVLVFERRQRVLAFAIAWCVTALFFLKITGFISAGLLCAFAFAAGRIALRTALAALALFVAVLCGLEASLGLVSAYVGGILQLVAMNEGVLATRFLQAASIHFGIFGTALCLLAAVAAIGLRPALGDATDLLKRPRLSALAKLLDRDMVWLAVTLFVGLFFETQNTGGQAFILLWPILLHITVSATHLRARQAVLVITLVAATAMPPFVDVLGRFTRAIIGQMQYVDLPHTHLRNLGSVTQRREIIERAEKMNAIYTEFPETFAAIAAKDLLPTFTIYSELDFQAGWLMEIDEAVAGILAYEAANGVRFQTIMSLNFVNPFPYLLDRQAPLHIAIGADPSRAVPAPDGEELESVRAADLILYPTCPITTANIALRTIYAAGLEGRREVRISKCWIGYLKAERQSRRTQQNEGRASWTPGLLSNLGESWLKPTIQ